MVQLSFFCISLGLVASAIGGSIGRDPTSSGAGVVINEAGVSETVAGGSAIAEHASSISVQGTTGWNSGGWGSDGSSGAVPALVSLGTGSSVGLSQYASNYQDSQINSDGSSYAYQGNYASNNGYADEYLYGDLQGVNATVQSTGWTAVEGEGAVAQADALSHEAPGNSGWRP